MQNLLNAFRFIGASFKLAFSHARLRKPWLYYVLGGFVFLILWLVLISFVAGLIGFSPLGLVLIGALSVILIAGMSVWGKVVSLRGCRTAVLVFADQPEAYYDSEKTSAPHWMDVMVLELILPLASASQAVKAAFKKNADDPAQNWTTVDFLICPIISLEDLSLKQAIQRARQMIADNLMRFRPGLVPVGLVAGIIQWMALICGVIVGTVVAGSMILNPATLTLWQRILVAGVGSTILWGFLFLAGWFSTFTRGCYHAALYMWVRNVENARKKRDSRQAAPPELLRQVLGSGRVDK